LGYLIFGFSKPEPESGPRFPGSGSGDGDRKKNLIEKKIKLIKFLIEKKTHKKF
jgi:hypothetical protein